MTGGGGYMNLFRVQKEKDRERAERTTEPQTAVPEPAAVPFPGPLQSEPAAVEETTAEPQTAALSPAAVPQAAEPETAEPRTALPPEIPFREGHLRLPNTIVFGLLPMLDVWQRAVYEELYLWTHGFGKNPTTVSQYKLAARLNTSDKQVRKFMRQLEAKGLVRILGAEHGKRSGERGTLVDVWVPGTTEPQTAVRRSAAARRTAAEQEPAAVRGAAHEREEKQRHETPVAPAPAPGLYSIREVAARMLAVHPSDTHHERVSRVLDVYAGQGKAVTRDEVEAALDGLAL